MMMYLSSIEIHTGARTAKRQNEETMKRNEDLDAATG
jgi:hypothetical protein